MIILMEDYPVLEAQPLSTHESIITRAAMTISNSKTKQPPFFTRSLIRGLRLRSYSLGKHGKFKKSTSVLSSCFIGRISHENLSQEMKEKLKDAKTDKVDIKILENRSLKFIELSQALMNFSNGKDIHHPNMCSPYELLDIGDKAVITSEYTRGRLLNNLLDEGCMSESDVKFIFRQISSCMMYCHQKGLIHYNLTTASIKVKIGPLKIIKIMDFGIPPVRNKDKFEPVLGPGKFYSYISPEVLMESGTQWKRMLVCTSPSSNVYSMGVILYEMVTGQVPFRGSRKEVLRQMRQGHLAFDSFMSADLRDLLKMMLDPEQDRRPSAHECFDHAWEHEGSRDCLKGQDSHRHGVSSVKTEVQGDIMTVDAQKPDKKVRYSNEVAIKYIPWMSGDEQKHYKKMAAKIKAYKRAKRIHTEAMSTHRPSYAVTGKSKISQFLSRENKTNTNHNDKKNRLIMWARKILQKYTKWMAMRHLRSQGGLNTDLDHEELVPESTLEEHKTKSGDGPEKQKRESGKPGAWTLTKTPQTPSSVTSSLAVLLPAKDQCGRGMAGGRAWQSPTDRRLSQIEEALQVCTDETPCEDEEEMRTRRYVLKYKRRVRKRTQQV